MSLRYKGAVISATPPTTTGGNSGTAPGSWTLQQQMQAQAAGTWPSFVPLYIEDVFSTYLYTGTGGTQSIPSGIDYTKGFLYWAKARDSGAGYNNHYLVDSERGANSLLSSNTTGAASAPGNQWTALTTTSITVQDFLNVNGRSEVGWTFRKQPKFFDVVTYTGTGSAHTISHNLGSTPGCIIVKCTSGASNWAVYHTSLGASQYMLLNSTAFAASGGSYWNGVSPTSTVFSVGNWGGSNVDVNSPGETYVAYLFADTAGGFGLTGTDSVITCGTYTGPANVTLGWEPQWILVKKSAGGVARDWMITDNMRGMTAVGQYANGLFPNTSGAETTNNEGVYINSTGFTTEFDRAGAPGETYIYIAIRRGPMKVPTDGTKVYNGVARSGTGANNLVVNTGNLPDMVWPEYRNTAAARDMYDRLRGFGQTLVSSSTGAEVNNYPTYGPQAMGNASYTQGTNDGANYNASGYTFIDWVFTRAPGFFDEVCYTGTGSTQTVTHNLGVVPELIILKSRVATTAPDWIVYDAFAPNPPAAGQFPFMCLNRTDGRNGGNAYSWVAFGNQRPTATAFYTNDNFNSMDNSGKTEVAYLFASCPGVSKVGSYTGTGATQTISCGFAGGARFVLVKRTDSTGDWYVWDTARGMVSGTDPSLLLNSTAAEVNANSIYTTTGGFQIVSTAAGINASGGSYIFLAVA